MTQQNPYIFPPISKFPLDIPFDIPNFNYTSSFVACQLYYENKDHNDKCDIQECPKTGSHTEKVVRDSHVQIFVGNTEKSDMAS